jgi:hypothetical protein
MYMLGSGPRSLICSCSVLKVWQCITTPHHPLKFGEWENRVLVYTTDLNLCSLKALLLPDWFMELRREVHNGTWKRIAVCCIILEADRDEWAYCFIVASFCIYKLNIATLTRRFYGYFNTSNWTLYNLIGVNFYAVKLMKLHIHHI